MNTHTVTRDRETVYLYQGEDLEKIRELAAAASSLRGRPRLMGDVDAAKAHDEFVTEARERAVKVVLEARSRKVWRDLVAAHPPREGHDGDKDAGVNDEAFGAALVPLSIVEPEFASDADRQEWVEELSDGNFERLYLTAFQLNRTSASPKADLSSRLARNSEKP